MIRTRQTSRADGAHRRHSQHLVFASIMASPRTTAREIVCLHHAEQFGKHTACCLLYQGEICRRWSTFRWPCSKRSADGLHVREIVIDGITAFDGAPSVLNDEVCCEDVSDLEVDSTFTNIAASLSFDGLQRLCPWMYFRHHLGVGMIWLCLCRSGSHDHSPVLSHSHHLKSIHE